MRRRALLKVVSAAASLALLVGAMAFAGGVAAITGMTRQSAVACAPAGAEVTTAPNVTGAGLEVRNAGRLLYELTPRQESVARTYIAVGKQLGIPRSGQIIAIMMALQESSLRMLANTSVPASLNFPNDGVGRDHDSIGSAQQRPAAGWGTVEQLMDAAYNARAFYGGPSGPNRGSPRGLLDIPGWQAMDKGLAAQAVQVSAFPELYARWEPAAAAIVAALEDGTAPASCADSPPAPATGGTSRNLSQLRQDILRFTQEGLGGRYVWGGTAFKAWDCSGFVQWIYRQAGNRAAESGTMAGGCPDRGSATRRPGGSESAGTRQLGPCRHLRGRRHDVECSQPGGGDTAASRELEPWRGLFRPSGALRNNLRLAGRRR